MTLKKQFQNLSNGEAVYEVSKKMFKPILYTVLTTICAFLSLIFSGIKPIIDFGWMMTLGLLVSLIVTFSLIPSLLSIFGDDENIKIQEEKKSKITNALSNFTSFSSPLGTQTGLGKMF